ncbi:TolC family protein [Sphingomonas sp. AP4-R1]|uniref:TolC family protein n=1 Tax=Sphingomonas sp. AP4-R1 TaxID=2735134 RepID=UPI0014937D92|nr:TolC family protein [Sphingomonas sp. AP4-R1]QJU59137.1 TolC family protein [Sphingomonas sp. AP4-R1]
MPLTLPSAIEAAESANIDVLTARLAVKTAQANLRSADTAPNPVFSVNAVQVRPNRIGNLPYGQVADTVARIDVPLERGGKRRARTGAARAMVQSAEDDFADARRQMRQAVTGAYFDLKAAEAKVELLTAIANAYTDSAKIAGKQEHAGGLSQGDLARQKVEAIHAQTDAQQAVTDWRESQLALAGLIGREAQAPLLSTTGDWPSSTQVSTEPADAVALRRPDVLSAQAQIEAARKNLDGAHALRYSDVTVGAQYERAAGDLGVGSSMGVGISVPIPVRNRYSGEVDAAGTALVQAEADARKALATATAEIVIARRALEEAIRRRQLFDQSELPAAHRAADVAEFAYTNGATSLLQLLDARRALRTTELGAIDAHSDEARAIARVRAAETSGDD